MATYLAQNRRMISPAQSKATNFVPVIIAHIQNPHAFLSLDYRAITGGFCDGHGFRLARKDGPTRSQNAEDLRERDYTAESIESSLMGSRCQFVSFPPVLRTEESASGCREVGWSTLNSWERGGEAEVPAHTRN